MCPQLSYQALDATLLAAWVQDKTLTVYLYGDGVIVHKTKDKVIVHHIHLTSGAPDYLSYLMNLERKQSYLDMEDNKKEVEYRVNGEIQADDKTVYAPLKPLVIRSLVDKGDTISVISDGINSFRKPDGSAIPWQDLLSEFTEFKNFEGEFVLRRMSAFKRKCLKEGTTHYDDISIASIVI